MNPSSKKRVYTLKSKAIVMAAVVKRLLIAITPTLSRRERGFSVALLLQPFL
jgi:hypothetical protein